MDLVNVCYQQIKGNFWYGLFADFKLIIDKSNGYFNATKFCKLGGKSFRDWYRIKSNRELLNYLKNELEVSEPIKSIKGNRFNEEISGTYVTSKLVVILATWISKNFAVKANTGMLNYFMNEFPEKYANDGEDKKIDKLIKINEEVINKNEELTKMNEELTKMNEELTKMNEELNKMNVEVTNTNVKVTNTNVEVLNKNEELTMTNVEFININEKLTKTNEELQSKFQREAYEKEELREENFHLRTRYEQISTAPKTNNHSKWPSFAVVKKNHPLSTYPYYALRTQRVNHEQTVQQLKKKYPDSEVIHQSYVPNPVQLFNKLKGECVNNMKTRYNEIQLLNGFTEEQLGRAIENSICKI